MAIKTLYMYITFHFTVHMTLLYSKFRLETAKKQDRRIGLMNDIISGIKLIKMYCWERPLANRILKARKEEISVIRLHFMSREKFMHLLQKV